MTRAREVSLKSNDVVSVRRQVPTLDSAAFLARSVTARYLGTSCEVAAAEGSVVVAGCPSVLESCRQLLPSRRGLEPDVASLEDFAPKTDVASLPQ